MNYHQQTLASYTDRCVSVVLKWDVSCTFLERPEILNVALFHRPVFCLNTTLPKLAVLASIGMKPILLGPLETSSVQRVKHSKFHTYSLPDDGGRTSARNVVFVEELDDGRHNNAYQFDTHLCQSTSD
jgi:hypothetical protein